MPLSPQAGITRESDSFDHSHRDANDSFWGTYFRQTDCLVRPTSCNLTLLVETKPVDHLASRRGVTKITLGDLNHMA
jgi:hypothetical protein